MSLKSLACGPTGHSIKFINVTTDALKADFREGLAGTEALGPSQVPK